MDISTNATHYFPTSFQAGRRVILDVCGDFGGGTVTPGYKAADGAFSPVLKADGNPVTITSRGGFELRVPRSGTVGITLAQSTGAALGLDVIAAVEMPAGA